MDIKLSDLTFLTRKATDYSRPRSRSSVYFDQYLKPIVYIGTLISSGMVVKNCLDKLNDTINQSPSEIRRMNGDGRDRRRDRDFNRGGRH